MAFLTELNVPVPSAVPVIAGGTNSFLKMFGSFLAVAAVLVLCMWGLRILSRRQMGQKKSAQLSVLSRVMLGRDSSVALVQVGSRVLVVGVTKENISLLCETSPEACACESVDTGAVAQVEDASAPVRGFVKRFVHNFGIVSGLAKGKQPMRPGAKTHSEPAVSAFSELLRDARAAIPTESPISGSQTVMESGGFSSTDFPEFLGPTPVPVEPTSVPVTVPESEGAVLRVEENQPTVSKAPMDYSATVARMKDRGRLMDSEPPVALKPVHIVGAAYEKQAASALPTDIERAGAVYIPSVPVAASDTSMEPLAAPANPKTTATQTSSSDAPDVDTMDRLMERVAARRDRLRRPEFGKEQA